MIPAIIAYQRESTAIAHAVGEHSDRAFCGVWATHQTERHWPTERDEWVELRPPCGVCAVLVYA